VPREFLESRGEEITLQLEGFERDALGRDEEFAGER